MPKLTYISSVGTEVRVSYEVLDGERAKITSYRRRKPDADRFYRVKEEEGQIVFIRQLPLEEGTP